MDNIFNFNDFNHIWHICKQYDITAYDARYDWIRYLTEFSDKLLNLKLEWSADWYDGTPDVADFVTFDGCVDISIAPYQDGDHKTFAVNITSWVGDGYTGKRERPRCIATFEMTSISPLLEVVLEHALNNKAIYLYDKEKARIRLEKIEKMKKGMASLSV